MTHTRFACRPRQFHLGVLACGLLLAALSSAGPATEALTGDGDGSPPGRSTTVGIGPLVPLDVLRPVLNGNHDLPDWEVGFGTSVAIDGDWLLVGVPNRRGSTGHMRGAVFFYQRISPSRWQQRQRILFGTGEDARCGRSVALHGRHAVIGCSDHTGGGLSHRGRTIFYERDPLTGEYGNPQSVLGDVAHGRCGRTVAIHGTGETDNTFAASGCAGGEGAVDVFQRVATLDGGETWQRIQTINNPNPPGDSALFGASVAIFRASSGQVRLAIGHPNFHHGGAAFLGGMAYLFRRDASGGFFALEISRSRPGGPQQYDHCGTSVALGPEDWFVGCPGTNDGGRVLAFHFNGAHWNSGTSFPAPVGLAEPNSGFGTAIATSRSGTHGDVWVGQRYAQGSNPGVEGGRVLRLQRTGGPPSPAPLVYVPVAHWDAVTVGIVNNYAGFGRSVAVDSATGSAVAGAPEAHIPERWGEVIVFGADRIFANGLGCRAGLPGC